MDWYDPTCFAIEIFDAKYEKVQIKDVVNPLEYLSTQQKADHKQALSEFTKYVSWYSRSLSTQVIPHWIGTRS